jgi:hypothetical protein
MKLRYMKYSDHILTKFEGAEAMLPESVSGQSFMLHLLRGGHRVLMGRLIIKGPKHHGIWRI